MGLRLLGRGAKLRNSGIVCGHLAGAAIGGAAVGAILSAIGWALRLTQWYPWVITIAVATALAQAFFGFLPAIGRQHQVPRDWARTMPAGRRYFLWGFLLGGGILTLVPYEFTIVIVSVQLVSGAVLGSLAGAAYGASREAMALWPIARRLSSRQTMHLLPSFRRSAYRINIVLIIASGLLLLFMNR
jgi:hypothetical protein